MHATITITGKTWDESRDGVVDAQHAVAQAKFTTEWKGDISGTSTCWLLISYVGGDENQPDTLVGPYTGYEQVDATIGSRTGTFVLAATGEHSGAVARTDVTIIVGSGTGDLEKYQRIGQLRRRRDGVHDGVRLRVGIVLGRQRGAVGWPWLGLG